MIKVGKYIVLFWSFTLYIKELATVKENQQQMNKGIEENRADRQSITILIMRH